MNNGNQALALRPVHTTTIDPLSAAEHFVKSGYFRDARDVSQAVVKILYGQEFGITAVTAMLNIHVIEGKPSMSAHMIGGVLRRTGYDFRVKESTNESCTIAFYAERYSAAGTGSKPIGESTFNKDDATRAGLWGKNNWAKFPKAMLFARAMSQGARMHCPDAFMGGVYTPDELGAEVVMNEQGEVQQIIDVTPQATHEDLGLQERFEAAWEALRGFGWSDPQIMAQYKVAAKSSIKFKQLTLIEKGVVVDHLEGVIENERDKALNEAASELED